MNELFSCEKVFFFSFIDPDNKNLDNWSFTVCDTEKKKYNNKRQQKLVNNIL